MTRFEIQFQLLQTVKAAVAHFQFSISQAVARLLLLKKTAASEGEVVEVEQLPKPILMLLDREERKDLAPINGLSINWEVESAM